jgi:hypothetical protein
MKVTAALVTLLLALPSLHAGDFFGAPTGPSAPTTSQPTATPIPAPTAPVAAATPKPAPLPAAPAAPTFALNPLGTLKNDLKAWFSFNGKEKGGVSWSGEIPDATLSQQVVLRDAERGRAADFNAAGAVVKFSKPINLNKRYTLAAWALFPTYARNAGMFFHGTRSALLGSRPDGQFACWVERMEEHAQQIGVLAKPLDGWHHIALCADGKQTLLYVDGKLHGTLPFIITEELSAIGNHPDQELQDGMMASGMDDVFIFSRELKEAEIARVMAIRLGTAGLTALPPFPSLTTAAVTVPQVKPPTTVAVPSAPSAPSPSKPGDFFGSSTGTAVPNLPTMPQTPATPRTPEKVVPPEISLPPAAAMPAATIASAPALLQSLGPMQTNVTAWFSFNSRERGGLTWSAQPLEATLSEPASLKSADGGTVADFREKGSLLKFNAPLALGPRYTLATWVLFPIRNTTTTQLFCTIADSPLCVAANGQFACWATNQKVNRQYYGNLATPLAGWHHLALSVDGTQSTLYLDGKVHGTLPFVVTQEIRTIGNHAEEVHQQKMMVTALDDVFIFNRDLKEAEVSKLMQTRLATTGPALPPVAALAPATK